MLQASEEPECIMYIIWGYSGIWVTQKLYTKSQDC